MMNFGVVLVMIFVLFLIQRKEGSGRVNGRRWVTPVFARAKYHHRAAAIVTTANATALKAGHPFSHLQSRHCCHSGSRQYLWQIICTSAVLYTCDYISLSAYVSVHYGPLDGN